MRALLFIVATLISQTTLADYYSAHSQVQEQQRFQARQEKVVNAPSINASIFRDIHRVSAKHGGVVSGPSPGAVSEHGVYYQISFTTRDNWECIASGGELKCANSETGGDFTAVYWRNGTKHIFGVVQGFF